jgi:hypothetical protein
MHHRPLFSLVDVVHVMPELGCTHDLELEQQQHQAIISSAEQYYVTGNS